MSPRPPGFLRPTASPDLIMMICTAGHVDHGKTRLVKLLTGCNTDRLKEEQERGLTIELGFAPCLLSNGACVGIVDVPGHEKFVRNMVAGVSGIDMAVLVVAADDGIMPQTIEHFRIMELVGVRHGMVALTKIDLVSPERVEEVVAQIDEFLEGTFMAGSRVCPVSSETLEGFSRFYEILVSEVQGLTRRRSDGVFRMPILNSFTREGFGSVITGIPVDGTIQIGDQVELLPGNQKGKVRGLQRFLRDAAEGGFGQCLALNISDLGKADPQRGQVLCTPGSLESWTSFHLDIEVVPGVGEPLRNAELVAFHTGTSERKGKLFLLEQDRMGEGERGLASVLLPAPVAAAVHDKFIIRRASPATTVAGGEIIGLSSSTHRPRRKQIVSKLRGYLDFFGAVKPADPERREKEVEFFLLSECPGGASIAEVARRTLFTGTIVNECLAHLVEGGKILALTADRYIHRDQYRARLDEAIARVKEASADANCLSLTVADLRRGLDWSPALWSQVQGGLEEEGLITRRGDKLVLESAVSGMNPEETVLMKRILAIYDESGLSSPRPGDLSDLLRAPQAEIDRLLDLLCARGAMFRLNKNVALSHRWLSMAQDKAIAVIQEKGLLDSGDFKTHLGTTRKYALAILDFLDSKSITLRRGNMRSLSTNHAKNRI
jgi:selenocysteine-specific elongation factor